MAKSKNRSWTDEQFIKAVEENLGWASTLRALGLVPAGGNYRSAKIHAQRLGLDLSHFTGQAWARGTTYEHNGFQTLDEILVEDSTYSNASKLKVRIVKAGLLPNECATCALGPEWNGKPLVLQLDHINGNNRDNRIENLRFLCPNCHSQTDTFCRPKG